MQTVSNLSDQSGLSLPAGAQPPAPRDSLGSFHWETPAWSSLRRCRRFLPGASITLHYFYWQGDRDEKMIPSTSELWFMVSLKFTENQNPNDVIHYHHSWLTKQQPGQVTPTISTAVCGVSLSRKNAWFPLPSGIPQDIPAAMTSSSTKKFYHH